MGPITSFLLGSLCILGGLWFIAIPFAFAALGSSDPDASHTWGITSAGCSRWAS